MGQSERQAGLEDRHEHVAPLALQDRRGLPPESVTVIVYRPAGPLTAALVDPESDAAPVIEVRIVPLPDPVTVRRTASLQVTVCETLRLVVVDVVGGFVVVVVVTLTLTQTCEEHRYFTPEKVAVAVLVRQ